MKKCFILFFLFSVLVFSVQAQRGDIYVRKGAAGLYVEHKVAPKESYFSIGRLYNVHPRHIASYNKADINKGLLIDQRIMIPLTDTNFTQRGNKGTPVYFKTGTDTDLNEISRTMRGVPVANLKAWNSIPAATVKKDTKLVIGFIQSKELPAVTLKPVQQAVNNKPGPESNVQQKPADPKPVQTEAPGKEQPKPVTEQPKPVTETKPVENPVIRRLPPETEPVSNNDQGYFKPWFIQQLQKTPISKEETVTAGIFKTASGWQDGKYYILIDAVPNGTIVKISNPSNTRVIYAKVLGEMAGIRQNEGYSVRISNAAASMLQISDTEKFILKVTY